MKLMDSQSEPNSEKFSELFDNISLSIDLEIEDLNNNLEAIDLTDPNIHPESLTRLLDITYHISEIRKINEDEFIFVDFDDNKLNTTGYFDNKLKLLSSITGFEKKYKSNNGIYFTFGELLDIIIDFEKNDRPKSNWYGNMDCAHRYFEGFNQIEDGFEIMWGS